MASPSPPPSSLSNKPHFQFPQQPSKIQQIPSKSHSNSSIFKTLILLVILLFMIQHFPSQAPDFITQTIITEFWEIIHLLFIGIAVSYGLFGRKSEVKIESLRNDDSHAYLSGIAHLSSIFEDGFGKMSVIDDDEQDLMQGCYYYANCFGDEVLGKSRCSSGKKVRSFVLNDDNNNDRRENVCDDHGKNVNQSWGLKYSKGESLVVVSSSEHFVGDFKPLNLPVRSLRSNVVDNDDDDDDDVDKLEIKNSPKIEATTKGKNEVKVKKIRGMVPMNLEKKFDESDDCLLSIPWRSRSGRIGNGDDLDNPKGRAHFRPHSIGEFEFEHIKSNSFRRSKFSSSPEFVSSTAENVEGKRAFPVSSRPKKAPVNDEASRVSRGRTFSIGNDCEEGKVGKGKKQLIESSDSDAKSSAVAKALPRGKSVRTIKPSRYVMNQKEVSSSGIDNNFEEDYFVIKRNEVEREDPPTNHQNQGISRRFSMPKPKPALPEFVKEEEEEIAEQKVTTESEYESEDDMAASEINESCDDEDDAKTTNIGNDEELEGSEVDRKAGEFIAKFREQIRLQKTTSSVEGYSREFL